MTQSEQCPSIASAYKILDYIITKAAVSGKLTKSKIKIPYSELAASVGQDSLESIDLIITIKTSWDETT